jgi:hypothetical protein
VDFPAWKKWLENREEKFWAELSVLVEGGKVELAPEVDNDYIYMSNYYPDLINNVYRKADDIADLPFPCEESLGITLPENKILYLNSECDFLSVMNAAENSASLIAKINFSDNFGSALVPVNMIPRQLTETAILKVRNYLKRYGNKEYTFHKLMTPLQGKEHFLKEQLEYIISRPRDAYNSLEDGRELTSHFWAHLCALARNDIKRKKDRLSMDIAAFQAFSVIDAVNRCCRELAVKQQEIEMAFRSLESNLEKSPYLYSMDQILKFSDQKGKLLLGQYSTEELETWLKKRTAESSDNGLPVLLVMKSSVSDEDCFLLKSKMLAFCVRLLIEARNLIFSVILRQWSAMLLEYKKEPAMEDDGEFEKELFKIAKKHCPDLMNLLANPKLLLVYRETEHSPIGVPSTVKIFDNGVLLPYSSLFLIRRKDILLKAKGFLPFWYSIPILFTLIGFFKTLQGNKKTAPYKPAKETNTGKETAEKGSMAGEIRAAASELEFFLVPQEHTLDSYLEELEDRWSRIIDSKAREHLVQDVQKLARDYLRNTLKTRKQFKPNQELISQMAFNLVVNNQALRSLSARDSLLSYLELYFIKLLENVR